MSFRNRVILASAATAAIAVLLACSASFLSTRNAVLHSVDQSLLAASQSSTHPFGEGQAVSGAYFETILPNGQAYPESNLPIDAAIKAIANGTAPQLLRTVRVGSNSYRELIVPLAKGSVVRCSTGACELTTPVAQLFSVNVTGQLGELHTLAATLFLVAIGGVLLALALGLVIARAAVRPLVDVTNQIEDIAETSDVKARLDEGNFDELGRLRRVFNRLLHSVDQSQSLQRQLVVDASHELRTPLTSLRTNAQVLSRASELSQDDVQQITSDMIAQVDELASLVTDLGELARGERSEGTIEVLRLDELTDDAVEIARTHARTKDVTIEFEGSACNVEVRRDRLTRAINNLLNNAIKFSPVGGRIVVTCKNGDVVVEDSGPGVPDSERANVFDRFWRSPCARSLPGSGLGLAIVEQVALEFGGSVSVGTSDTLGGAKFTLTIPETD